MALIACPSPSSVRAEHYDALPEQQLFEKKYSRDQASSAGRDVALFSARVTFVSAFPELKPTGTTLRRQRAISPSRQMALG
jgi:hypothetical protein